MLNGIESRKLVLGFRYTHKPARKVHKIRSFLSLPSSMPTSSPPSPRIPRIAPVTSPIIQRSLALEAWGVVNFEQPRTEIGVDEHVVPQQLEAATIQLLRLLLLASPLLSSDRALHSWPRDWNRRQ